MPLSVTILSVGRKNDDIDSEVERYAAMVRPYVAVRIVTIKPPSHDLPEPQRREAEAKLLQTKLPARSYSIALSEEGKLMTSIHFSQWLMGLSRHGLLTFTIGGAYGLAPDYKKNCKEVISLSPLTLPHKLCMVVLVEQIYRAFTIFHHHPYHK